MRLMSVLPVVLFCACLPLGAQAQPMEQAPQACTAVAAPPAALSGWMSKASLTSATSAAALDSAMLTIGQGATVMLHPTREVSYVTQPEKPGGSVAHGGLIAVTIAQAGTYQISLSAGAWIDLLKDEAPARSSAHSPGPACTGIRKTVQFPLQPGRFVIQLSANADPTIQVLVSKVP